MRALDPSVTSERRQVTTLFSDLSGYTRLAEQLDPEELREVLAAVIQAVEQTIQRYGGQVAKLVGDGVMALFGARRAEEDDPVRAVVAALEIHDCVARLEFPSLPAFCGPLRMHSGISTGIVLVQHDPKKDVDVLGDSVNLASRLSEIAAPGQVLMDAETLRLASRQVDCQALGWQRVKGRREPVEAFLVRKARTCPLELRRAAGLRSRLVGREGQIERLRAAAERLVRGESSIVGIGGEAGTGKTRLVAEFRAHLGEERFQWREAQCQAYARQFPYFPLVNMMSRVWHIEDRDSRETIRDKVGAGVAGVAPDGAGALEDFARLFGVDATVGGAVDPESWKSRVYQGMLAVLEQAAVRRPLIVLVEDLHWADPYSLDMLRHVMEHVGQPVLFICTYRTPYELLDHHATARFEEMLLADLPSEQAKEMAASLLETPVLPSEVEAMLRTSVGGNPLFVEEMIHSLVESGRLFLDGGVWWHRAAVMDELALPSTLRGLIQARVDRAEEPARSILREASVMGRGFSKDVLFHVTRFPDRLDDSLASLVAQGLISSVSGGRDEFVFKHALIQESVYAGLLRSERRGAHELVARAMEEMLGSRSGKHCETLAFHYVRGEIWEEAARYLADAGDMSLNRYAGEQAQRNYQDAYALLRAHEETFVDGPRSLLRLVLRWAFVLYYLGSFRELENLLLTHQELSESLGDRPLLARYEVWLGTTLWHRQKVRAAREHLARGVEYAEECGDLQTAAKSDWRSWPRRARTLARPTRV